MRRLKIHFKVAVFVLVKFCICTNAVVAQTACDTLTTVTDYDGNIYPLVSIGNQCWMAKNLATTHYSDGTPLVDGTGIYNINWLSTTPYYFPYNDSLSYVSEYGLLYSWHAVMKNAPSSNTLPSNVRGICPDGFHLPSVLEWQMLQDSIGGSNYSGGKLKEAGFAHWISPNSGATNSSGFTAIGAGQKDTYGGGGAFASLKQLGGFWSTTVYNNYQAYLEWTQWNVPSTYRGPAAFVNGFSCRCILDTVFCHSFISIAPITCGTYTSPSGDHVWTTSGIYSDTISVGYCDSVFTINLTILPNLQPQVTGDTSLCIGESTILSIGNNYNSYLWSTGETTATISVNVAATYTVTVSDASGCTGTGTITVTANPPFSALIAPSGPVTFCSGESVVLSATSGMMSYQWFRNNVSLPLATLPNYTATIPGNYTCLLTDLNGCIDNSNLIHVRVPCVPIGPEGNRIVDIGIIDIYPNPFTEKLTINIDSDLPVVFELFEVTGKLIISEKFISETTISTASLAKGIYIYRIGSEIGKLVKQ